MSAIDKSVGMIISQSSAVTVRHAPQGEFTVRTPAQPQVQLPPCIDPQRYKNSCQRWRAIDHPQAGELKWISRHLDGV